MQSHGSLGEEIVCIAEFLFLFIMQMTSSENKLYSP